MRLNESLRVKPMLWKGRKREAKRLLGGVKRQEQLRWAMSIEPGDYIGTCDGCNRQVTDVEIGVSNAGTWLRGRAGRTEVVTEVRFTDSLGNWHFCPGGGCAYPPKTPEAVTEYFRGWAYNSEDMLRDWFGSDEKRLQHSLDRMRSMREALVSGQPIVDEHGELLPEFSARIL